MVDSLRAHEPDLEEARALLALERLPGVGLLTLAALVRTFGSAKDALGAPKVAFTAVAGAAAERSRRDPVHHRAAESALAEALRLGMSVLTWSESRYPAKKLLRLHDPPPVLFLRGNPSLLTTGAVTVVGSRRATARARDIAERLGNRLSACGVCVVSGMAFGVDAAAHRGALETGGRTIAVLGRGADSAYPAAHRRLFRQIVERGLVVSEFPPGTPPLPHHFPRRNRILAGLSDVVVVVEAAASSGSLITADHALDLGLDVWAVPGPIDIDASTGSNRLIADGAGVLVSVPEFVREVSGRADSESSVRRAYTAVGGPADRILAGFGAETLSADQLADRAGLTPPAALAALTELELAGLVRRLPGMLYRKAG